MRPLAPFLVLVVALAPALRSARAQAPDAPQADTADAARRHFRAGLTLYKEGNYPAALAEFEAAYRLKPGPGSLQNVALCHKALFRYAEAADSLKGLLERHSSELTPDERSAAELAHKELSALVASLVVEVTPTHAAVTLDGRPLAAPELGTPLRVNVGEHALVADAPGYARISKTIRVAAGPEPQRVTIELVATMGFVEITASDTNAVIAIDGRPLALGRYHGPVSPDEEHLVQVYQSGFQTFEERIKVERGKTARLGAALGPAGDDPAPPPASEGTLPPPPEEQRRHGWYSIAALNLLAIGAVPLDFDKSSGRASSSAVGLGLRVGRQIWPTLGGEVVVELGSHRVEDACDKARSERAGVACGASGQVGRDYSLGWLRFGPIVRLSTPGEPLSVNGGFGAGLVLHELRLDRVPSTQPATDPNTLAPSGGRGGGIDPFAVVELGASVHFGHLFVGLDVTALVDGTRSLRGSYDGREQSPFEASGLTLPMVGVGLRVGYHEWQTKRRQR